MPTRHFQPRLPARPARWGSLPLTPVPPRAAVMAFEASPLLVGVLATIALGIALLVTGLVDGHVTGDYALVFRTLWWLMLCFNVVDAFVQRSRLEAWNTLLLKYVMVGVTYSILV